MRGRRFCGGNPWQPPGTGAWTRWLNLHRWCGVVFCVAGVGAAVDDTAPEAPEGVVYCGGGDIKRQIEYAILENADDQWDVRVTVNGETLRAMTSYSYFGSAETPAGFFVALLGEDRSEFLVFRDGGQDWLEFGDYRYDQCN